MAFAFVAAVYGRFLWPPEAYGIVDSDRFLAWQLVVNDALRHGALLHWNPYLCGGIPGLAEPESGVLSPLNVLGLFTHPAAQMKLELFAHLAACFAGYELIARHLRVSPWIGLVGFFVATGNGFVVARVLHGQTTFFPVLLVPLLVFCVMSLEPPGRGAAREPIWRVVLPYALVSLALLEDGFQPILYGAVLFFCMSAARAVAWRSWRPVAVVLSWLVVPTFLCAARTFPMVVLLASHPRNIASNDFMTLDMAKKALFSVSQLQLYDHFVAKPPHFPWAAYCAFLGVSPVLLGALGIAGRRAVAFAGVTTAALVGIGFFFGHFASWAPWTLLHAIPPLTMVRFPNRFIIVPILAVSLFSMRGAGIIVASIERRASERVIRLVLGIVLFAVAIEYVGVTGPLFVGFAERRTPPASRIDSAAPFLQYPGRPGSLLAAVSHNVGAVGCSEAMRVPNAALLNLPPAFLADGGPAHLVVLPNEFTVDFDAPRPTTLVLNQNFDPNFRVVEGNAQGEPLSMNGLLAVDVPAGRGTLRLAYDPSPFHFGVLMSFVALLGAVWWLRRSASLGEVGRG